MKEIKRILEREKSKKIITFMIKAFYSMAKRIDEAIERLKNPSSQPSTPPSTTATSSQQAFSMRTYV